MEASKVCLKFWGVRGSIPTPQIENLKFGGNTSCVEIRSGENESVIFDGGSGIRALGDSLMQEAAGAPINAKIFLTHFHWDHIQGIPFFAPLYGPKNHISFISGTTGMPLCRKFWKARWRSRIIRSISVRSPPSGTFTSLSLAMQSRLPGSNT